MGTARGGVHGSDEPIYLSIWTEMHTLLKEGKKKKRKEGKTKIFTLSTKRAHEFLNSSMRARRCRCTARSRGAC